MNYDYSPKPIADLMKHMHKTHGIQVRDEHVRQMINYGYYHSYKGYRFFKKPQVSIPYTKFEELIAVIDYDNGLKAAFYPEVMFLETALKNIVCATVIEGISSADFKEVYKQRMNDEPSNSGLNRQRNHFKQKIQSRIAKQYQQNNSIISHFRSKGDLIPLWAVIEIMTLGDFASFCYCLNKYTRVGLLRDLRIRINEDKESQILSSILYALKDLRNAIAHNSVVFDTRFREKDVHPYISSWLMRETDIDEIDFSSIFDYYILICVLLSKIEYENHKLFSFMNEIEGCVNALYENTAQSIYTKLTTTQYISKIKKLKEYINRY